jgi:hypothetical protein
MLGSPGSKHTLKDKLVYWITEREAIRKKKDSGWPKPWSDDPVFQSVYFTNVHREDDKVTRFLRQWAPVADENIEFNTVLARFINWPDTLQDLGYQREWRPDYILNILEDRAALGIKTWGSAYIITTHGLKMPKAQYLVKNVLEPTWEAVGGGRWVGRYPSSAPTLRAAHAALMQLEGLGSFLAAQVVADLKNTPLHPLMLATDWSTWAAPGPGSLRGLSWYYGFGVTERNFEKLICLAYDELGEFLPPKMCMQDLQNCFCEFDKYMRVSTGVGRSKRNYDGYR